VRINHTGIAVEDLDEASERYTRLFGFREIQRVTVADQHVTVAFLRLGDSEIELLSPTDSDSAVGRFLERHGEGLHHVAVETEDIRAELARLQADGVELIDNVPRRGAHGLVAFVHPRAGGNVLWELVQLL
jgi:methylmalonyl-CoA epimerase